MSMPQAGSSDSDGGRPAGARYTKQSDIGSARWRVLTRAESPCAAMTERESSMPSARACRRRRLRSPLPPHSKLTKDIAGGGARARETRRGRPEESSATATAALAVESLRRQPQRSRTTQLGSAAGAGQGGSLAGVTDDPPCRRLWKRPIGGERRP
ncbi:hypothetical protein BS78_05G082000 [Paspalum vaginatum]|nr:hypothetical protein BS78_05G082000 [Paspalum vaginatum]